jgi:hypothetical protein
MTATLAEPDIVMRKGQPVSVIIPIKDCEACLEHGEDTEDMTWLKRAASNLKLETRNMELRAAAGVSDEETLKPGVEAKSKETEGGSDFSGSRMSQSRGGSQTPPKPGPGTRILCRRAPRARCWRERA